MIYKNYLLEIANKRYSYNNLLNLIENEFEASVKEGYNAINIKFIRPDDVDLRIIERIISRLTREGLSVHIINSLNFRLSLYETVSSSEIIKTTYL